MREAGGRGGGESEKEKEKEKEKEGGEEKEEKEGEEEKEKGALRMRRGAGGAQDLLGSFHPSIHPLRSHGMLTRGCAVLAIINSMPILSKL